MINCKKITAFLVTLALLFNFCFIIPQTQLTLSAEESTAQADYSVNYLNVNGEGTLMTKEELAAEGTSLIAGQRGIPYAYDAETDTHKNIWLSSNVSGESLDDAANVLAALTDGELETKEFKYFGGNAIPAIDFEYDLGKTVTVDKFLFLARNNVGNDYYPRYTGAYDVYLANSKADLYKAESKIYSYNYETDGISRGQIVTFKNKSTGRYLAVRVTRPYISSTSYNYPRLSEIAVYGEEYDASETADYSVNFLNKNGEGTLMTKEELAAEGTSLIAGQRGIPYAYDAETDTHKNIWLSSNVSGESLNDAANVLAALTDGELETKDFTYFGGNAIPAIDFEYDLGKPFTVDKFLFLARNNVGNDYYPRYTGAYDVYLADSKADLYKPESKIYSYNYETDGISRGQIVTFKNKSTGRYLAVRVTRPYISSTSYNYPRLSEIAVYGEEYDASETADYSVNFLNKNGEGTLMTKEELAAEGTSLIAGQRGIPYAYDAETDTHKNIWLSSNVSGESLNDAANVLAALTDGELETKDFTYFGGNAIPAIDFEYDLGKTVTVDKFLFLARNDVGSDYSPRYTGAYDVYLADSKADLYKPESKIYSYNYETDGISRGQIVTFKNKSTGRYLAVRVTRPYVSSTSYNFPRLSEIAVYGTSDYDVKYHASAQGGGYLMTDEELAELGTSLIGGRNAVPYMYDSESGTYVKKYGESSDNYYENGFNGLTDGIVTKDNDVCNKNGQIPEPVYLKYDLGADCKIDSFLLMGTNNTADWINEIYTGAYEVYLSSNENDLFNTENIIYSYDYTVDGIYRGQIVTFNKQYTGRYIAVRIINPVTTNSHPLGRIAEIAVYGNRVNKDTGDVNGDGFINSADLIKLIEAILGEETVNSADVTYYDVHTDGQINILDLVRIKKIILGYTVNFQ